MSEHDQRVAEQRRPVDIDQLYPSRFLRAVDLNGREQTITIEDVFGEDLTTSKGVQAKAIVRFKRTTPGPRELVLAKINACALRAMWGSKRSDWIGKRLTLFASSALMPMPTGPEKGKPCLRVLGSPDITEEIVATFSPPRRKPVVMRLRPTGAGRATKPQPSAQPSPAQREVAEKDDEPDWPPNEDELPPGGSS